MSSKKSPAHIDHVGYWLVTFVYYEEEQAKYDTVIHDDTLTSLLLELNKHYQRPSIMFAAEVSKAQYAQLEAAMDAVETGEEVEAIVDIGGGYTARIPPDMDDHEERESGGDPDETDEGDPDLERDGGGLDDDDLGGDFDEN